MLRIEDIKQEMHLMIVGNQGWDKHHFKEGEEVIVDRINADNRVLCYSKNRGRNAVYVDDLERLPEESS